MSRNRHQLAGRKFGRLEVIKFVGATKHGQAKWECKCECGAITTPTSNRLLSGKSKSCGCLCKDLVRERSLRHGYARKSGHSPEYKIWAGMIGRCHNPNSHAAKGYSERGIKVCDRWRNDFAAFLADMGQRPAPEMSLDRIDNNGDYVPGNVRWATPTEQMRNVRSNRIVVLGGRKMTVAEAAEGAPVTYESVLRRIAVGWTIEEAVTRVGHRGLRPGHLHRERHK